MQDKEIVVAALSHFIGDTENRMKEMLEHGEYLGIDRMRSMVERAKEAKEEIRKEKDSTSGAAGEPGQNA